jgi:hypothetical protein
MKISTRNTKLIKSSVTEGTAIPFETRSQNSSTPIPNMTATER